MFDVTRKVHIYLVTVSVVKSSVWVMEDQELAFFPLYSGEEDQVFLLKDELFGQYIQKN